MKEIEIIKKNYEDIRFVFEFYDRFAVKLQKADLKKKGENTLVFFDYHNDEYYYVTVETVNRILDYCYGEYFFKEVLSGCDYYQRVKKVSDDLEIEPPIFDLFFRSYFLAIKDRYYCEIYRGPQFTRQLVRRIVARSYSDAFDNYPVYVDHEYYLSKSSKLLDKLEELGLVCYKQNDITLNLRLTKYFPISCDTFKFYITKEKRGYEFSMPMFDYLDLKRYLDNQDFLQKDLLTRMDRTVQTLIIISFHDVKFHDNEYSDNSYIKRLRAEKLAVKI